MTSKFIFLGKIVVCVLLASAGAENYCQDAAILGASHTTKVNVTFKQTGTFEWSFDGESVSCNVTNRLCSSSINQTKYRASIVLLADEKIQASFTILAITTKHRHLPLVWTEKMDTTGLTFKRDSCKLVTYEPYTPEVYLNETVFDGTTKINLKLYNPITFGFVKPTVKLEMRGHNPKNGVIKKDVRIIYDYPNMLLSVTVETRELSPGTYTAYLILYPNLKIGDPAKDLSQTFEINTYTFDIKPPVCRVSTIMKGEQFVVYCTSERSYFPDVDCAIIKTDRKWGQVERFPGKTQSRCEASNGKCVVDCFLFQDVSFSNIGNVSFRAEMIPVVVNKNLVIADAVESKETDLFEVGGQFCPTHAITGKQYTATLDLSSKQTETVKWSFGGEDVWCSLKQGKCNATNPRFGKTTIIQRGGSGSISSSFVVDSIAKNDTAKIIEWTEKDKNNVVLKNTRCQLQV